MPGSIIISQKIRDKLLQKHDVAETEVKECFANRCGASLIDSREEHASDPPTQWLIAETNKGRLLKVVFICRDGNIFLRSAFEPNQREIDIYEAYAK
jgi:uncharacterized DUF497 family protein